MYLLQLLCNTNVVLLYIRLKGANYDITMFFGLYETAKTDAGDVRTRKGVEV